MEETPSKRPRESGLVANHCELSSIDEMRRVQHHAVQTMLAPKLAFTSGKTRLSLA